MPKTHILGALLTASGLLNLYTNFHPDWLKNEPKTICPYMGIRMKNGIYPIKCTLNITIANNEFKLIC